MHIYIYILIHTFQFTTSASSCHPTETRLRATHGFDPKVQPHAPPLRDSDLPVGWARVDLTNCLTCQCDGNHRYKWTEIIPINGQKWMTYWGYFTSIHGVISPPVNPFFLFLLFYSFRTWVVFLFPLLTFGNWKWICHDVSTTISKVIHVAHLHKDMEKTSTTGTSKGGTSMNTSGRR